MSKGQQQSIKPRHILPVFKVISSLEDPKFSNQSISLEGEKNDSWKLLTHNEQRILQTPSDKDERLWQRQGQEVGGGEGKGSVRHRNGSRGKSGQREKEKMDELNYSLPQKSSSSHKSRKSPTRCQKQQKTIVEDDVPTQTPEHLNFSANFTPGYNVYDIKIPKKRIGLFTSMAVDIPEVPVKETSNRNGFHDSIKPYSSENPVYEDPRDLINPGAESQLNAQHVTSAKRRGNKKSDSIQSKTSKMSVSKESKSLLKDQKRKLTEKYESLIVQLMDRCEENMILLGDRQSQVVRMKEKLKTLHLYNNQFADENEVLRKKQDEMKAYIEECKKLIDNLQQRNIVLENQAAANQDKGVSEESDDKEVPLVAVCMSCSTKEILLKQSDEQNTKLNQDMIMLKNVVYRLNVQLSRYQDKLKDIQSKLNHSKVTEAEQPSENIDNLNLKNVHMTNADKDTDCLMEPVSIPTIPAFASSGAAENTQERNKCWGDVNIDTLAPLLNAYQESIQEKDDLIRDYEKQFNVFTLKFKQIVTENNTLHDKYNAKIKELTSVKENVGTFTKEREKMDAEIRKVTERAENAEQKLKEVYEMYEDKVATMNRDYETVHREYFTAKTSLAVAEAKLASIEESIRNAPAARTVPADMHERRIDDCKRLFEELKHQYSIEKDKMQHNVENLQQRKNELEMKIQALEGENKKMKEDLKQAVKSVRLYRRAAVIFRARLRASVASVNSLSRRKIRSTRKARRSPPHQGQMQPLDSPAVRAAMERVDKIKSEIQTVKLSAYKELEEVERRIKVQEMQMADMKDEYDKEISRLQLVIEHKEKIIHNLIDKVADIEDDRLDMYVEPSYGRAVPHESRRESAMRKPHIRDCTMPPSRLARTNVKFTPGPGGYYMKRSQSQSLRRD